MTLEASPRAADWAACSSSCLMMDYRATPRLHVDLAEMADMFPHLAKQFVIGPWHAHQESLATLCTVQASLPPPRRCWVSASAAACAAPRPRRGSCGRW